MKVLFSSNKNPYFETFTEYIEKEVLRKRPYLKKEWYTYVLEHPTKVEP